jgi:hypothetical protein
VCCFPSVEPGSIYTASCLLRLAGYEGIPAFHPPPSPPLCALIRIERSSFK